MKRVATAAVAAFLLAGCQGDPDIVTVTKVDTHTVTETVIETATVTATETVAASPNLDPTGPTGGIMAQFSSPDVKSIITDCYESSDGIVVKYKTINMDSLPHDYAGNIAVFDMDTKDRLGSAGLWVPYVQPGESASGTSVINMDTPDKFYCGYINVVVADQKQYWVDDDESNDDAKATDMFPAPTTKD